MTVNKTLKIALLATLVLALAACNGSNDGTCYKERNVAVGVALYKTEYNESQERYVVSPVTEQLTVQGLDNDSLLCKARSLSTLSLPLRITVDSSVFTLQRDSTGIDTLVIYHTNEKNFISLECGCFVFHTIKSVQVTANQIDSAILSDTKVNNVAGTHLRLYYRKK